MTKFQQFTHPTHRTKCLLTTKYSNCHFGDKFENPNGRWTFKNNGHDNVPFPTNEHKNRASPVCKKTVPFCSVAPSSSQLALSDVLTQGS